MSIANWYKSSDNELNYEISIYDDENDLVARFNAATEEKKNEIIEQHYRNNESAKYYEVKENKIIEKDYKDKHLI